MINLYASERELRATARLLRGVLHSDHPTVINVRDRTLGNIEGLACMCRFLDRIEATLLPPATPAKGAQ